MKLAPIIKVLREQCPSFEKRVFGTFAWLNVDDKAAPAMPCAYVLPQKVTADVIRGSTKPRQDIDSYFDVVVCVPLSREDALGRSGHDLIEDLKDEVFKAILFADIAYPDSKNRVVAFQGQAWHSGATNAARLAETLSFSIPETLMGDDAAQGRIIDELPDLDQVRARVKGCETTDGDDSLVTAELLIK